MSKGGEITFPLCDEAQHLLNQPLFGIPHSPGIQDLGSVLGGSVNDERLLLASY